MNSKNMLSVLMIALGLSLAGCGESQGPAEQAGEKIDESMEATTEKLKEAGEEMGDAMEEAGDKVEEATEN
ncbi:uncharacterized protein FOKN1_1552 [Thiohalobacter thiocyanaticus]|uniref:Uncharacterized protein n=1 Tax=Thiohalobacter thiocyanaticus TaxID=585455 RepID=A0A1Z4VQP1_9GAMM|nr:hypothetical protein [Thiohalobacter thiocyanaticus]BAZ93947.1 uncharacterized protein FOKN1_1552 [Thiohalobacter thiocyanaticus]